MRSFEEFLAENMKPGEHQKAAEHHNAQSDKHDERAEYHAKAVAHHLKGLGHKVTHAAILSHAGKPGPRKHTISGEAKAAMERHPDHKKVVQHVTKSNDHYAKAIHHQDQHRKGIQAGHRSEQHQMNREAHNAGHG